VDRHAWQDLDWAWHAVFALFAGLTAVLLVAERRWLALGLLVAVSAWYAATGARALHRPPGSALGMVYVAVAEPLVLVLFALTPTGAILLFLLFPHIWRFLPTLWAVVASAAAVAAIGLLRFLPGADDLLATATWLAVMLLAAVLMGLWITRITGQSERRAALLAELERTRAELAAVNRDLGALAERERLARDIHDTVAQGFTSILLLAQAMDPADPKVGLIERTARQNLAESRALVAALSPAGLDAGSLPAALQRLVDGVGEELGIGAEMRVEGVERALPAAHEVVLLRVCQESVANVRKHAGASRLEVLLAYGAGTVLRISDDGRGFEPGGTPEGFGLAGMRERVREVGGTLRLSSTPDRGTCVEVGLP
jgi:signal transduction histidine kinase